MTTAVCRPHGAEAIAWLRGRDVKGEWEGCDRVDWLESVATRLGIFGSRESTQYQLDHFDAFRAFEAAKEPADRDYLKALDAGCTSGQALAGWRRVVEPAALAYRAARAAAFRRAVPAAAVAAALAKGSGGH